MEMTNGVGGCSLANNGGGPSVPPRAKRKTCRMPGLIDLTAVLCPEASAGELHWAINAGSGEIRSCASVFFSDHLVLEGALRSSVGSQYPEARFLVPWCRRRMSGS
jgi:hypothetical protein